MFKIKNIKVGRNGKYRYLAKAVDYVFKKIHEFAASMGYPWYKVYCHDYDNVRYVMYENPYGVERFAEIWKE